MSENVSLVDALAACASLDAAEQRRGLTQLKDARIPEHLSVALGMLNSTDPMVRSMAVETSAALALAVASRLLPLLQDTDPMVRADTTEALATMRFVAAGHSIEPLLDDEDATVRASAAEAIGVLGNVDALPRLERALHDEDEAVRGFAALSVGLLGLTQNLELLESILITEESAAVRAEVYAAQYRLGQDNRLEPLLEISLSADFRVATVALNSLADLASSREVARLRSRKAQIDRVLAKAIANDAVHEGIVRKIGLNLAGPPPEHE